MMHALRVKVAERPVIADWKVLHDYLRADIGFEEVEHVRALYLDSRNGLIADELLVRGTIDEAPLYVRQVLSLALDFGAAAIVIAHNHPAGTQAPSSQDIEITRRLCNAAKPLRIAIHDHLIFTRHGHTSFRSKGLI